MNLLFATKRIVHESRIYSWFIMIKFIYFLFMAVHIINTNQLTEENEAVLRIKVP